MERWGVDRELRAQTVELLEAVNLGLARLAGSKRRRKLRRIPRPTPPDHRRQKAFDRMLSFARSNRGRFD